MIAPVSVVAQRSSSGAGRPERDAGHGRHSSSVAFHLPGAAYRRVLGSQTRVLGADHPDTPTIRGDLTYSLTDADLCQPGFLAPSTRGQLLSRSAFPIVCAGNTP
jgi:hypothetical protein